MSLMDRSEREQSLYGRWMGIGATWWATFLLVSTGTGIEMPRSWILTVCGLLLVILITGSGACREFLVEGERVARNKLLDDRFHKPVSLGLAVASFWRHPELLFTVLIGVVLPPVGIPNGLLIPPQPIEFPAGAPRRKEPPSPLPYTLTAATGGAAALKEHELRRARTELQRVELNHSYLERRFRDLQAAHSELTERERSNQLALAEERRLLAHRDLQIEKQNEELQAAHSVRTERERSHQLVLAQARRRVGERDRQIAEQIAEINRIQRRRRADYLGPFGSEHAVHQAPPPGDVVVGDRVTFEIRGTPPIHGSDSERILWQHGGCLRALTRPRGARVVFEAVWSNETGSPRCHLRVEHRGARRSYPLTIRRSR